MTTFESVRKHRTVTARIRTPSAGSGTRAAGRTQIRHVLDAHRLQTKLTVNVPNDVYEREADRVADKIVRMPGPNGGEQWAQRTCLECQDEQVQRQPVEEPEPDEELE